MRAESDFGETSCVEFLARSESGVKVTRTPNASRLPGVGEPREASGVRRVHRRFPTVSQRQRRGIFVEPRPQQNHKLRRSDIGNMPLLTERGRFGDGSTTNMPALTGEWRLFKTQNFLAQFLATRWVRYRFKQDPPA